MRGLFFFRRRVTLNLRKPAHNPPTAARGVGCRGCSPSLVGWRLCWASAAGHAGAGLWGGLGLMLCAELACAD